MDENLTHQLVQVAEATLVAAKDLAWDSETKAYELFEALILKTKEGLNNGISHEKLRYSYAELANFINVSVTKNTASSRIKPLIDEIQSKLEEYSPGISARLHKQNFREIVNIGSEGKRKYFYLVTNKVEINPKISTESSKPELLVYEPISKKFVFGLSQIKITNKHLLGIGLAFLAFSLFLGVALYLRSFGTIGNIGLTITSLISWVLIYLLKPFTNAVDKGLAPAPFWIRKSLELNYFIIKQPSKSSNFKLAVRTYKAICPICEARIEINKGSDYLKGRWIGECELSPEHKYTFDHVRERGVPALTPMFIPKT